MSDKIKIVPKVIRLIHLIDKMDKGEIKIPSFQRGYVWDKNQRIELFDSINREYPIGSMLLWKPEKEFKIIHELGPFIVEEISQHGFFYILDGVQRLSTLFGCLINPNKTNHGINSEKLKEFTIYYDLDKEEFNIPRNTPTDITNIPVYLLIDTFGYLDFVDNLRTNLKDKTRANELVERGTKLSSILIDYQIIYFEITGGDVEQAVNIFYKVNSTGSTISKDWMVSALTNNESEDFNLGTLINDLLTELEVYNFQDLKREVILQCIQNSFGKFYVDVSIEDLIRRDDFIPKTKSTIRSIKKAIQFLFEELLVVERRVLPYNNQLIFLTYFFDQISNPSEQQKKQLEKWFWVTTYSNYFSTYSLSKKRIAFYVFKDFVEGRIDNPVFNDKPEISFTTSEFPKRVFWGSVRSSALILFLLNFSNNFKSVDSNIVEGLDLHYLFFGNKSPENSIPILKYFDSSKNRYFSPEKHKDLSFLLEKRTNIFNQELNRFFLTKEMIGASKSKSLTTRKSLIIASERKFVEEELGLIYDLPATILL